MDRTALHKGYAYQDLVTACFMVDAVLLSHHAVYADQAFPLGDKIDDITVDCGCGWIKCQIKHSTGGKLAASDLKNPSGDLRLSSMIKTHMNFKGRASASYRSILRRFCPDPSDELALYLVPTHEPSVLSDVPIKSFQLNATLLWPEGGIPVWPDIAENGATREIFLDFVNRFRIELEWPTASFDLNTPGEMEGILLDMLRNRLGIGIYPNENTPIQQVAGSLVHFATECRTRGVSAKVHEIVQRLQLRTDFGRVAQRFPVDPDIFVPRAAIADQLSKTTIAQSITLLVGPPGSGKSWLLTKLAEDLTAAGHTVCRHYCYLDPSDAFVEDRIKTDVLYGNLIAELVDLNPNLKYRKPTLFGADKDELESLLEELSGTCDSTVVIIDGLDHVFRVFEGATGLSQDETQIIEAVGSLIIPERVHLLLGSQPGEHVAILTARADCVTVELEAWEREETEALVKHMGMWGRFQAEGEEYLPHLIDLLHDRGEGNALYLTYLLRGIASSEALEETDSLHDYLERSPVLNGDIACYYKYLLHFPRAPSIETILDLLALLPFAVSAPELKEIHPHVAHSVDDILLRLKPVLRNAVGQGGARIYHESLRRYAKEQLISRGGDVVACLTPAANWLEKKGFWINDRAFRFLITLDQQTGQEDRALSRIGDDFVWKSVSCGHCDRAIINNLLMAAQIASSRADFPALCRIAQLRRAATACFEDGLLEMETYAKAFIAIYGPQVLADRLLFEGRAALDASKGLEICMLCDEHSAVVPWAEYLAAYDKYLKTHAGDPDFNISQGDSLARLRGRLVTEGYDAVASGVIEWLQAHCKDVESNYANSVLELLQEFGGNKPIDTLTQTLPADGIIAGLARERLVAVVVRIDRERAQELVDSFSTLADRGEKLAYFDLGLSVNFPESSGIDPVSITREMIDATYSPNEAQCNAWVQMVSILAISEPALLRPVQDMIFPTNWYRRWLHFSITAAVLAARRDMDDYFRSAELVQAIKELSADTKPFKGKPRTCDLFQIRATIHNSIGHALSMLAPDPGLWSAALSALKDICIGTTTYLDNSASGPLTHHALMSILTDELRDNAVRKLILKSIDEIAELAELAGTYFVNQGEHSLMLAEQLGRAGLSESASDHFRKACEYMCSYTFRKDTTFLELLTPIREIATRDKHIALKCLRVSHPLIAKIVAHTDLRETNHFANAWFRELCATDIDAAAQILAWTILEDGAGPYWVYEVATKNVAKWVGYGTKLGASLLSSLPAVCPIDEQNANRVLDELDKGLGEESIEENTAMRVVAQILDSNYSVPRDVIRYMESKHNISRIYSVTDDGIRKEDGSYSSMPDSQPQLPISPRMPIDLGSVSTNQLIRLLRGIDYEASRDKNLIKRVSNAVGYRLCELLQAKHVRGAGALLDGVAATHPFGMTLDLDDIAHGLERHGYSEFAADVLARAYFIGSDSSYSTDYASASVQRLTTAVSLSRPIAIKRVCREALNVIESSPRAFGVSPSLTCASVILGDLNMAEQCWTATFGAISARIPDTKERAGPFLTIPSEEESKHNGGGVAALILARVAHPDWLVRTMSLGCALELAKLNPTAFYSGLLTIAKRDITLPSLANILAVLAACENIDTPSAELVQMLAPLQKCGYLNIEESVKIFFKRCNVGTVPSPTSATITNYVYTAVSKADVEGVFSAYPMWKRKRLSSLWPEFTQIVTNRVLGWLQLEPTKRRVRDRIEAFVSQSPSDIPARHVGWHEELIEIAVNEVGAGIDRELWARGEWSPEKAQIFRDTIHAAAESRARYSISRVPRPKLECPVNVTDGTSDPAKVGDGSVLHDWFRVAWMETQLVYNPKGYREVDSIKRVFAGLVIEDKALSSAKASESLGGVSHVDTWTIGVAVDEKPILPGCSGPLVGLSILDDCNGELRFLTWHPAIHKSLGLRSTTQTEGCALVDANGDLASVLRWWWTKPFYKSYGGATPEFEGCEILLRPDLLSKIEAACAAKVNVVRETHAVTR